MSKGVSIVICCYNSSSLLSETLKHICNQKVPSFIKWEVIVVDNNSTDDTSGIAKSYLEKNKCPAPFKIIFQAEQGLSKARKTGLDNSKYEYIIFCDDDNRLNENYVEKSYMFMESNPDAGVAGASSEAVTDGVFPEWFGKFSNHYSIGRQGDENTDLTWTSGYVWGAGMVIRRSALKELYENGYTSNLSDREGEILSSGGDVEICFALRLAGWKILYSPELKFSHFISKERLNWEYLRKLNRGFGAQKADFDAYLKAFDPKPDTVSESLKLKWYYQTYLMLRKLRGYGFRKLMKFNKANEGDDEILRIEKSIGKLYKLMKMRGEYFNRMNRVKNAPWRKVYVKG